MLSLDDIRLLFERRGAEPAAQLDRVQQVDAKHCLCAHSAGAGAGAGVTLPLMLWVGLPRPEAV